MIFVCCHDHYSLACRNAFVGVVAKGGLRGLYTGWGAVLCRNVPHSIIKARSSLDTFHMNEIVFLLKKVHRLSVLHLLDAVDLSI